MPQLASWECCTGCGACFSKCPQKCISFKEDKLGNIYPFIDEAACVNCRQCEKVCPQITTYYRYTFANTRKGFCSVE